MALMPDLSDEDIGAMGKDERAAIAEELRDMCQTAQLILNTLHGQGGPTDQIHVIEQNIADMTKYIYRLENCPKGPVVQVKERNKAMPPDKAIQEQAVVEVKSEEVECSIDAPQLAFCQDLNQWTSMTHQKLTPKPATFDTVEESPPRVQQTSVFKEKADKLSSPTKSANKALKVVMTDVMKNNKNKLKGNRKPAKKTNSAKPPHLIQQKAKKQTNGTDSPDTFGENTRSRTPDADSVGGDHSMDENDANSGTEDYTITENDIQKKTKKKKPSKKVSRSADKESENGSSDSDTEDYTVSENTAEKKRKKKKVPTATLR